MVLFNEFFTIPSMGELSSMGDFNLKFSYFIDSSFGRSILLSLC